MESVLAPAAIRTAASRPAWRRRHSHRRGADLLAALDHQGHHRGDARPRPGHPGARGSAGQQPLPIACSGLVNPQLDPGPASGDPDPLPARAASRAGASRPPTWDAAKSRCHRQPGPQIEVLADATRVLSQRRWGALLVLERETSLGEYVAKGVALDAVLSVDLIEQIFHPNTRLHDGAAIVRGERVMAAACLLPLAESIGLDPSSGHAIAPRSASASKLTPLSSSYPRRPVRSVTPSVATWCVISTRNSSARRHPHRLPRPRARRWLRVPSPSRRAFCRPRRMHHLKRRRNHRLQPQPPPFRAKSCASMKPRCVRSRPT